MRENGAQGIIYHYTSADGLHGILSSGTLYFTDSLFLNDRSERKNLYRILEDYIRSSALDKSFKEAVEQRYFGENDYISRNLKATDPAEEKASRYFVLSCSRERDSLPMWNYFTRGTHAAGYNLHFDPKELLSQMRKHPQLQKLSAGHAGRRPILYSEVVYEESKKRQGLSRLLHQAQQEWFRTGCDEEKERLLSRLDGFFEEMSLFYKDSAFCHEKEVRIVLSTDNRSIRKADDSCYQFRKVRGIQIPYLAVDVLEKGRVITGVTAGPALDKEMAVNGVEYMLYHYGFPQTCKVSSVPLRY